MVMVDVRRRTTQADGAESVLLCQQPIDVIVSKPVGAGEMGVATMTAHAVSAPEREPVSRGGANQPLQHRLRLFTTPAILVSLRNLGRSDREARLDAALPVDVGKTLTAVRLQTVPGSSVGPELFACLDTFGTTSVPAK